MQEANISEALAQRDKELDGDLIDVLSAISVISKRLAQKISEANHQNTSEVKTNEQHE